MSFFKKLFQRKKADSNAASEVVLESQCPGSPVWAVVEQDSRVAFLYLMGGKETNFGTKHCWIRNLQAAPVAVDTTGMQNGLAPMLPAANCKFPNGQTRLRAKDLQIVWFPEGDAAALLENGVVIAIIPSWSGIPGFSGYARDCIGNSAIAWELTADNRLHERVRLAKAFHLRWEQNPDPFQMYQPKAMDLCEAVLGPSSQYYALDGGYWPPVGLYFRGGPERSVFVTVGMALRPQPQVELATEHPEEINHIELGMILPANLSPLQVQEICSFISAGAAFPWEKNTWIGEGHTATFPPLQKFGFSAIIHTAKNPQFPELDFSQFVDHKVNLLWGIPITEEERLYAIESKSTPLLEELANLGPEIFSFSRRRIR